MRNIAQIHTSRRSGGNATVAANVRSRLGYADLKQGTLAEVLGLSQMAISRRLSDQTEFTAGEIVIVADFFGVSPGDLFVERGPRKTQKTPTANGEGVSLPRLDSNQQPAGAQLAPVTRIAPTSDGAETGIDATVTRLFG